MEPRAIMVGVFKKFGGASLGARAMRSSFWTTGSFVSSQVIRLLSNLVLTRLLFPEAFGMMALVTVFIQGLANFSDVGVTPAILQSKRGDDPDFLNTAWTIQIFRGVALWLVACAIGFPLAWFYDEPMLAQIMPIAGLGLLIIGFKPTRLDTANRHLLLGRVAAIEVAVQIIGVVFAIALAWWLKSVWALVISGLLSQLVMLGLAFGFLPGLVNTFRWEKAARHELVNFGKWIFLSTVCGFFFFQADKILIGKWLPLDDFGVYNIGFFLATVPMMLGNVMVGKVLIPIYREAPPKDSPANFAKLRKMRFVVTGALVAMVAVASLLGVWAVELLYDPRYAAAGAVVVVLALMQLPQIISLTYDQAALAAGDSKRFFILYLARAFFMFGAVLVGLELGGLFGAIIGQGVAYAMIYPVVVWLSRHTGAWDPLHDAVFGVLSVLISALALWVNWAPVAQLMAK
ncbi:MAG: oligosaccharide flippase family protein [Pseudomonadota bacterium]|nr:oligosaccharide flippase family protein [Pseudomonadota bacterium]